MVSIALIGWPLVVLALFATIHPRRAVIAAFLGAWLFLPMAGWDLPGFGSWDKITATAVSAFVAVIIFDPDRLLTFRPRWFDLPMLIWCFVPFASSVSNGLGWYDGASATWSQTIQWGLPYLIGRMYFYDLESLRELAIGIFIGGLIYVPFCLYEIRMSPQLHQTVYGFHQHSWRQTQRFGGWRPDVFMQHGLMVGMWMSVASVIGLWLWRSGALRHVWGVPMVALMPVLLVTTVLTKSFGAIMLCAVAVGVLFSAPWLRTTMLIGVLALAPLAYMSVRSVDLWDGEELIQLVEAMGVTERTGSLRYRLEAEDVLAEHAWRQPVFGWGAHSRNRPARMGYDAPSVATDGLWIIAFGQRGLVGLVAMTTAILLPVFLIWRRMRIDDWVHPLKASAGVLALVLLIFMIDSLFNAMYNPIYMLAAGGLTGGLAMGLMNERTNPAQADHPALPTTAAVETARHASGRTR